MISNTFIVMAIENPSAIVIVRGNPNILNKKKSGYE
jgi:hypothetical protein